MSRTIQRLRPTRATLATFVGFVWALSFGAIRDFVWADLREGMISTRGMPRAARLLTIIGLALLMLTAAALIVGNLWRHHSPLITLFEITSATSGRGALLPATLLPITLFLFALAWAFLLTGALHSHWALRLLALFQFMPMAVLWATQETLPIGLFATIGILVCFIIRWRSAPKPGAEFIVMLALVTLCFASGQAGSLRSLRDFGQPTGIATIELMIEKQQELVLPLLLLIGVDIAAFTQQAASWSGQLISTRLPRFALYAILGVALVLRLSDVLFEVFEHVGTITFASDMGAYFGGLISLLAVGTIWLLAHWRADAHNTPNTEHVTHEVERVAFPLILLFLAPILLGNLLVEILAVGQIVLASMVGASATIQQLLVFLDVSAIVLVWFNTCAVLALLGCFWLIRRGRRSLAVYLGAFGVLTLWSSVSSSDSLLPFFAHPNEATTDLWLMLLVAGFAAWWAIRRQLTAMRAGGLLMLVLVSGLLRQTDFIENPFSPFFGFAGVGFIAFGIIWDSLTAGSWANDDTRHLPRVSRVFLYLGYTLLTATLLNWALASHNLTTVDFFTGDTAVLGLERFGKPVLFLLFPLTLAALAQPQPSEATIFVGGDEAASPSDPT